MKEKIVWIFVVLYLCSFHLNAQNAEKLFQNMIYWNLEDTFPILLLTA